MGGVDNGSMESIIVLGADRVGKTTTVGNSLRYLEETGLTVTVCHFGGVSPKHHSPVQQFVDTLSGIDTTIDYLLIDRFVSDTLFYEPYRYQLPPIPDYVATEPESMLLEMSSRVRVVLIEHEWDMAIRTRHEQEIRSLWPGCTDYWVRNQVEKRRLEHESYYDHTGHYLASTTLIDRKGIYLLPGHLAGNTPSLEMAGGFSFFGG
jgi:hypothetical protein